MSTHHHFQRVEFTRFKAFNSFSLSLSSFNILVGPNNAGKSTVIAAFRILASAMRRAQSRKPELVRGPRGQDFGYPVDLKFASIAEENLFYNYDDNDGASVVFTLSNANKLTLFFPEHGACFLFAETQQRPIRSPSAFRSSFNCKIGFVPILGPVDHNEPLYEKEAARLALYNYRAARNFRNIWFHYPEQFHEFRTILQTTWPGMDIERPIIDSTHFRPVLHMFCPEDRIPREIFWSGFGFQVWCQMLTHMIQSRDCSIFLIDEPDIYLHSDLQRQLLSLLRNLGPDILIATHSTEMVSEAEPDELLIINKRYKAGRRVLKPAHVAEVFTILGSNINPVLTQLAKTRRVVFVEGKDFQIISKFARKLNCPLASNRSDFAVIPAEGFNPSRIKDLKRGMEETLGSNISAAVIFDRDYRSDEECSVITKAANEYCHTAIVHRKKEIENFLLVPEAIDRAADRRVRERAERSGKSLSFTPCAREILTEFANTQKNYLLRPATRVRNEISSADGASRPNKNFGRRPNAVWCSVGGRRETICARPWQRSIELY